MRIPVSYDEDHVEVLNFDYGGELFDFNANGTTRVSVKVCDYRSRTREHDEYEISSDNGSVEFSGENLNVMFGKLLLPKGLYEAVIRVYSNNKPDGVVICGPGRPANIVLQASC